MEHQIHMRTVRADDFTAELYLVVLPQEDYRIIYRVESWWQEDGRWVHDTQEFADRADAEEHLEFLV